MVTVRTLFWRLFIDKIVDVSTAVTTTAGKLKAKYIIHVVSPIWSGGVNEEDVKLANAMDNV